MGQRVLLRCAGARPRFHSDPLAKDSAQGDTAPPTGRGVEPVGFWDPQELSEGCDLLKFLHLRFEELQAPHTQLVTARRCRGAVQRRCRRTCSWRRRLRWPRRWPQPRACMPRQGAAATCAQQLQAAAAADGPPPAGWAGFGPPGVGRSAGAQGGGRSLPACGQASCLSARPMPGPLKKCGLPFVAVARQEGGETFIQTQLSAGDPRTPRGAIGSPGPWSGCQSCQSSCRLWAARPSAWGAGP